MYFPLPAPSNDIQCRLPDIPLPPYRYVPGIFPHPTKNEKGHSFHKETLETQGQQMCFTDDVGWLRGLDLFDQRFYWEAHEVWEERWKQLRGPEKSLLQGMILAAACLLQRHMGREKIAARSWQKAKRLLKCSMQEVENIGIDMDRFIEEMDREVPIGGWPQIRNSD